MRDSEPVLLGFEPEFETIRCRIHSPDDLPGFRRFPLPVCASLRGMGGASPMSMVSPLFHARRRRSHLVHTKLPTAWGHT